jgi:hypothetical protein
MVIVVCLCAVSIGFGLLSVLVQMAAAKHEPEKFRYPSGDQIKNWT